MKKVIDEKFIEKTFKLAEESLKNGDDPFGAIVVCDGKVVSKSQNTRHKDITGHAEVNAIKQAIEILGRKNLSDCTLYTNFEPCAMCSFLIRDINFGRVVFSVPSPHFGGNSKWNILKSKIDDPLFTTAQHSGTLELVSGVLQEKGRALFERLNWKMHK